jgi:hypothetical protein
VDVVRSIIPFVWLGTVACGGERAPPSASPATPWRYRSCAGPEGTRSADELAVPSQRAADGTPARCGEAAPSVLVVVRGWGQGKLPAEHANLVLEVRNPLEQPVWFFPRGLESDDPMRVRQAEVYRLRTASSPAYLWRFSGSTYQEALRVAPGATVVVRGVEEGIGQQRESLVDFDFASDVFVGGTAAQAQLGVEGVTLTGDIVLDDDGGEEPVRACGHEQAVLVSFSVRRICTQVVRLERYRLGPCPNVSGLPSRSN